jgi:hypothetical protein
MKTPPKPPKATRQPKLPPGAHNVPGSDAYRKLQGAPRPKPVVVDAHKFATTKGGPELKLGNRHFEVKDRRTRDPR